jgi:hypothetical protein
MKWQHFTATLALSSRESCGPTGTDHAFAVKSRKENVEHVYGEMPGRVMAWDLIEEIGR